MESQYNRIKGIVGAKLADAGWHLMPDGSYERRAGHGRLRVRWHGDMLDLEKLNKFVRRERWMLEQKSHASDAPLDARGVDCKTWRLPMQGGDL